MVASPDTVTATGPEHELIGIQVRTQQIDLSNQRANFEGTVALYPYDATGRLLSDVNVTPATVNVAITVVGVNTTRTASVVLGPVIGAPAGDQVTVDGYTPVTVTLTGSQDLINGANLATLTTTSIDIAGQTGTVTYHVTIQAPAGISGQPRHRGGDHHGHTVPHAHPGAPNPDTLVTRRNRWRAGGVGPCEVRNPVPRRGRGHDRRAC